MKKTPLVGARFLATGRRGAAPMTRGPVVASNPATPPGCRTDCRSVSATPWRGRIYKAYLRRPGVIGWGWALSDESDKSDAQPQPSSVPPPTSSLSSPHQLSLSSPPSPGSPTGSLSSRPSQARVHRRSALSDSSDSSDKTAHLVGRVTEVSGPQANSRPRRHQRRVGQRARGAPAPSPP